MCTKHITPPKWDSPLISQNEIQLKTTQDINKDSTQSLHIHDTQLTYTTLNIKTSKKEAYRIQTYARNKTNTCKGQVTLNVNMILNTSYRNEEHWI